MKPIEFTSSMRVVPAGEGPSAAMLVGQYVTLMQKATTSTEKDGAVTITGQYEGPGIAVPFSRVVQVDGGRTNVRTWADLSALGEGWLLADWRIDVGLDLAPDEHERMLAFGGATRDELFRMDMNDVRRRGQNMSDTRCVWPYWDIGGVLQLPGDGQGSYVVWKANGADTQAYPVEQGVGAPGWADYSDRRGGLTVTVDDPVATARQAPWAIEIDARAGVMSIQAYPPSQPPASGPGIGRRELAFTLHRHEGTWPVTHQCELSADAYARLLTEALAAAGPTLDRGLGLTDIDKIIHTERIQPSVVLRLLYRSGDGPMRDLLARLGRSAPPQMTLAQWDAYAADMIRELAIVEDRNQ